MKERTLKNGVKVPELERPVELVIKTKCPNKWKLIDLETNQEYIGTAPFEHEMHWKLIKNG
jgi:hypothetical protein